MPPRRKNPRRKATRKKSARVEPFHAAPGPVLNGLLPAELGLHLFTFLDPVTSTCLGVTCRAFYGYHNSKYQPGLPIATYYDGEDNYGEPLMLKPLLHKWIGADSKFSSSKQKFVGQAAFDAEMAALDARVAHLRSLANN